MTLTEAVITLVLASVACVSFGTVLRFILESMFEVRL